ncbi:MAG: cell division protein FtsB [Pseudomonadales bacterium]|nr:cell division protein FtsB [Pseudomonadales bacterium]
MRALILALVVILLVFQYRLWVGEGSMAQLRQLEQQVQAEQMANADLRQRNQRLEQEVLDLKNGMEAIEERARSELGMIKEDETFYLIVD